MRGVYGSVMLGLTEHTGSSPRTWGLLGIFLNQFVHFRFIPTCVGFTAGKGALDLSQARFIPTHVGFTIIKKAKNLIASVHPHARGVYAKRTAPFAGALSVHPHARGVYDLGRPLCKAKRRFIPTHVGFTNCCRSHMFVTPVHPHARGVYVLSRLISRLVVRFIPTHVGFTAEMMVKSLTRDGSSPRTWGLRKLRNLEICGKRFIPTHVGFTHKQHHNGKSKNGSSPRTWGLLARYT